MIIRRLFKYIFMLVLLFLVGGCAGSGSTHSTIYYDHYYDPYPYWGYGDDTTVIIDLPEKPDRPEKPSRPPGIRPPKTRPRR